MDNLNRLIGFLNRLEEAQIYYRLNKVRDAIMVEIAIPGERWEIEFMDDGEVVIEKFISTGGIYEKKEVETLFEADSK